MSTGTSASSNQSRHQHVRARETSKVPAALLLMRHDRKTHQLVWMW